MVFALPPFPIPCHAVHFDLCSLFLWADDERVDWTLYAANVRQLMGRHLGVPLVEQARGGATAAI